MLKKSIYLFTVILFTFSAALAQSETEPTTASNLTDANLPWGAERILPASIPAEVDQVLDKLITSGRKFTGGRREVLVWTGGEYRRSSAPQIISEVRKNLSAENWSYTEGGKDGDLTVFSLIKSSANKRIAIGFFMVGDKAMVLAWSEVSPLDNTVNRNSNQPQNISLKQNDRPVNTPSGGVIKVDGETDNLNLAGNQMPGLPSFPALAPKPGVVRGYVKDAVGNPLVGAAIGLKTATIGVDYVTSSAVTDANGYYEVKIPLGGGKFHYAGYEINYAGGRAALGLHPADGSLSDSYAVRTGGVENFVLLAYGIADEKGVRENPKYRSNFYGGNLKLTYHIAPPGQDLSGFSGWLAPGSEIEITLTPEGYLIDGTVGKTFTIRKTVEESSIGEFYLNNIPVGKYRITAKMNGRALNLKQKTSSVTSFGMQPGEASGSAVLTFNPLSGKANTAMAGQGNWNDLEILLERP